MLIKFKKFNKIIIKLKIKMKLIIIKINEHYCKNAILLCLLK